MTHTPNLLVIMSDQHSRHALGCYGDEVVRTPNLDRLAGSGMRFDDAYCPSPLCVPSRMSFMTSRTPSVNQVWNNNHILGSGVATWAHALTIAGYETALLGRMHFCGADQRHGFESRPVGEPSANVAGASWRGGPPWTRFPAATSGQCRGSVTIAGRGSTHYQWCDEDRTRVATQWLRERAGSGVGRPFAAVLGYTLPHCPFVAPKELFDYYYDRVDIPAVEEVQPATVRRFRALRGLMDPELPSERIRVARAAYYGLCEHLDRLIGDVLDTLDETGLARDTLVIYTSDHGEMAGEHGCWWKSNYYEGSVGVPLIACMPGTIAAGSTSRAVCNLMDIGPTLAEAAGTEMNGPLAGRSLMRVFTDGMDSSWPDETFSELIDHRGGTPLPSRMIRSGPWKLWTYADREELPPALFNLDDDPKEVNDLGQDEEHAGIRDRLLARVSEGWDPDGAVAKSVEQWQDFDTLKAWGLQVDPDSPYVQVLPSADLESDVELL